MTIKNMPGEASKGSIPRCWPKDKPPGKDFEQIFRTQYRQETPGILWRKGREFWWTDDSGLKRITLAEAVALFRKAILSERLIDEDCDGLAFLLTEIELTLKGERK